MNNNSHFSKEQLLDFMENRLDPVSMEKVSDHLSGKCLICEANLGGLTRIMKAVNATNWPAPSFKAHSKAIGIFHKPIPQKPWGWPVLFSRPVLIGFAMLTLILVFLFPNFSPHTVYAAQLENVTGQVDLKEISNSPWLVPLSGQSVPLGATIRTSDNGQAVIKFPDGTSAKLGVDTQVELAELSKVDGQWKIQIYQTSGKAEILSALSTIFRIQTTYGYAVANKANFSLSIERDGRTEVKVNEGNVNIDSTAGSLEVNSGQTGSFQNNRLSAFSIDSSIITSGFTQSESLVTPSPDLNFQNNQNKNNNSQQGNNGNNGTSNNNSDDNNSESSSNDEN
jgi:hypothetical protein